MKSILNGVHEGQLVSLPVIIENGEISVDPSVELTDIQRSWTCLLGFHVRGRDGKCVNCGKVL